MPNNERTVLKADQDKRVAEKLDRELRWLLNELDRERPHTMVVLLLENWDQVRHGAFNRLRRAVHTARCIELSDGGRVGVRAITLTVNLDVLHRPNSATAEHA